MQRSEAKTISVLIVAHSRWLPDALRAIVRATLQVECIDQATDGSSALKMLAKNPATLLFLEAALPGNEAWFTLRQIKAAWPQTQCLVLADNAQQGEAANAAGADAVLLKGFGTPVFNETILALVSKTKHQRKGVRTNGKSANSGR
jgi:DNA-binding NarL/FixJ family response regulator